MSQWRLHDIAVKLYVGLHVCTASQRQYNQGGWLISRCIVHTKCQTNVKFSPIFSQYWFARMGQHIVSALRLALVRRFAVYVCAPIKISVGVKPGACLYQWSLLVWLKVGVPWFWIIRSSTNINAWIEQNKLYWIIFLWKAAKLLCSDLQ